MGERWRQFMGFFRKEAEVELHPLILAELNSIISDATERLEYFGTHPEIRTFASDYAELWLTFDNIRIYSIQMDREGKLIRSIRTESEPDNTLQYAHQRGGPHF